MPLKNKGKGKKGVKQQKRNISGPWRDTIWQAKADNEGLKRRLWDLEKALEQAQENKRDICEAARLWENQQTQETASWALAERDRTITQLQGRLDATEMEYEKILHGSLDLVLAKMAEASQRWEELGTTIAMEHKERLQEFGLNPREI